MANNFDYRIVAVIIAETPDGSPSWVVITNDGYPTVYDCWVRVPRMVRYWLAERNDSAYSLHGTTVIGKAL